MLKILPMFAVSLVYSSFIYSCETAVVSGNVNLDNDNGSSSFFVHMLTNEGVAAMPAYQRTGALEQLRPISSTKNIGNVQYQRIMTVINRTPENSKFNIKISYFYASLDDVSKIAVKSISEEESSVQLTKLPTYQHGEYTFDMKLGSTQKFSAEQLSGNMSITCAR